MFKKISSPDPVINFLARRINEKLVAHQEVLWFISGGSVITIAIGVCQQLAGNDLTGLTVTLTDERYGPVGHPDSNWQQLQQAGFALPGAKLIPVLAESTMQATALQWEKQLQQLFAQTDYHLGLLGIGPDGHTSGILPGRPAFTAKGLVAAYDWSDYKRITTTPKALALLDTAIVYAIDKAKQPTLDHLDEDLMPSKQPAQLLKHIPELLIFNDYKGDSV